MEWETGLKRATSEGDEVRADEIAAAALEGGVAPKDLLERGAVAGIYEAGRLWQEGTYFLPDIILATEAYKEVMKRIEPLLESGDVTYNKGMAHAYGLRLGKLDGFERLIAAIYGTPDRVPVLARPYTYAMGMHGLTGKVFFSEPRPFIHASCNFAR